MGLESITVEEIEELDAWGLARRIRWPDRKGMARAVVGRRKSQGWSHPGWWRSPQVDRCQHHGEQTGSGFSWMAGASREKVLHKDGRGYRGQECPGLLGP